MVTYVTGELVSTCSGKPKTSDFPSKKYYDQKAGESGFKVGDWVYRWYPPAAHGKFGSGWTGPYLVIQRLSALLYRIQASKRARPKVVHVDHLKKYYFEDDEEPDNWLEPGTGKAEDLRTQTEEGQGDSSQSGEVETPGVSREIQTLRILRQKSLMIDRILRLILGKIFR